MSTTDDLNVVIAAYCSQMIGRIYGEKDTFNLETIYMKYT